MFKFLLCCRIFCHFSSSKDIVQKKSTYLYFYNNFYLFIIFNRFNIVSFSFWKFHDLLFIHFLSFFMSSLIPSLLFTEQYSYFNFSRNWFNFRRKYQILRLYSFCFSFSFFCLLWFSFDFISFQLFIFFWFRFLSFFISWFSFDLVCFVCLFLNLFSFNFVSFRCLLSFLILFFFVCLFIYFLLLLSFWSFLIFFLISLLFSFFSIFFVGLFFFLLFSYPF